MGIKICAGAVVSPSAVTERDLAPPTLTPLPQSTQPEPPVGVVNFIFCHNKSTTAGRGGARQGSGCRQPAPGGVHDAHRHWAPVGLSSI